MSARSMGLSQRDEEVERRVLLEVRALTRREVIPKMLSRQLTRSQAAQVPEITPRHQRRVRRVIEPYGMEAVLATDPVRDHGTADPAQA